MSEGAVSLARLDQFLKWSRLIPRRPLAKATCDAGRVRVNDQVARPGKVVQVGDVVVARLGRREVTFRVRQVPVRPPGKAEAQDLIEILGESGVDDSDA